MFDAFSSQFSWWRAVGISAIVVLAGLSEYRGYRIHQQANEIKKLEQDLSVCNNSMVDLVNSLRGEDIQNEITRDYIEQLQNAAIDGASHGPDPNWLNRMRAKEKSDSEKGDSANRKDR